MRSLRSRFILSHILPIVIVLPLASIALIYLLETQVLLNDLADDLTERAQLIAAAIDREPEVWQDPALAQSLAQRYTLIIDGRLLILGSNGELLGTNDPALKDQFGQIQQIDGLDNALDGDINVIKIYTVSSQGAEVLFPITDVQQQLVGIVAVTQTLEGIGPFFTSLRWFVLGLLGIQLLAGVIAALILAARLEAPISRAARAVVRVSEWDSVEPIAVSGPTEIQQLSTAVNILVERLRDLEENRKSLLANLVHELGRPLGAIRAAIHVLRRGAAEDEATQDELLLGIEDEVARLQPILDDLAQLHGVILGHVKLNRKRVNLSNWLPSTIIPWRAAALEHRLKWTADIPADLPSLNIDPDRMSQVVGNLLSNGIKYTPAEGNISVSVKVEPPDLLIVVSDSGPGIDPEEREKVFEPFYRSSRDRRFPQGMGLGLTIARDLVEAHGGMLKVYGAAGQGSQFVVHLPLNGETIS